MEQEQAFNNNPRGNRAEHLKHKDRFMELMETRHRNAMTALKIEQILSREEPLNEYPTTQTSENIRVGGDALEAMGPIFDSLSRAGLTRKAERVKGAIDGYLTEKIRAQRVELGLKKKLLTEGRDGGVTPAEIGSELFRQRTGESPKKLVEAVRREGYFILAFWSDDDYLQFAGEEDKEESAGLFHRAMRFPNMMVGIIMSRYGFGNRIILHERQHFINASILQDFADIENCNVPPKQEFPLLTASVNKQDTRERIRSGLCGVKDELLARIRDGSDQTFATNFFDADLYKYLSDQFLDGEQKEVSVLLKEIESKMKSALDLFTDDQSRGILVYHLVDIPLLRFPQRISAIVEFYNVKINEFTNFIPDDNVEKYVVQGEKISDIPGSRTIRRVIGLKLEQLRREITGEAYHVANMVMVLDPGSAKISYNELQEKLKVIKIRLKELREDYDNLLAKV